MDLAAEESSSFALDPRVEWASFMDPYIIGVVRDDATSTASAEDDARPSRTAEAVRGLTAGIVNRTFCLPAVEAEFTRFLHRATHVADAATFAASFALFAVNAVVGIVKTRRRPPGAWAALGTGLGISMLAVVASVTAHVVLGWRLKAAATAATPAANVVDAEMASAKTRRLIAGVVSTLITLLLILAESQSLKGCFMNAAPEVSEYEACARRVPANAGGGMLVMAVFIRHTGVLYAAYGFIAAVWLSLELTAFADEYETGDSVKRVLTLAVFVAAFFFPMHVTRDRSARQHFVALVLGAVADARARDAHRQTAAFVAALLPAGIAQKVVESADAPAATHTPRAVDADAASARDFLAPLLATLFREAAVGTVCITEAADMAAFERKVANPRRVVHGMCHLFTLFDIGAGVFGVERAGCFGDSFTVAAGLEASGDGDGDSGAGQRALDVCRFALWQLGLDEVVTLPLRACVVSGRLRGAVLSGGGGQHVRYHVSGPALSLAAATVGGVPAQHAWACRDTLRLAAAAQDSSVRSGTRFGADLPSDGPPATTTRAAAEPTVASVAVADPDAWAPTADGARFTSLSIADVAARPRWTHDAAGSGSGSLPIVQVEWTAAGSVARPDHPTDDVDPYLSALVHAAQEDRARWRRQHVHSSCRTAADADAAAVAAADACDDSPTAAQAAAAEAAAAAASDAFPSRPCPLLPAAAALVAAFALLIIVHGVLLLTVGDAMATAKEFSPVAFTLLSLAACVALATAAVSHFHQDPCRLNMARCALLGSMSLIATSVWWMPSTVIRNTQGLMLIVLGPIAIQFVVDTLSVPAATLVIAVFISLPMQLVFIPRHYGSDTSGMATGLAEVLFTCAIWGVLVWFLQRETRAQFDAKHQAERRASVSLANLARMRALVQGMVPAHAILRAVEESGIETLRQRVTTMPGAAADTNAVQASSLFSEECDDAQEIVDARAEADARVHDLNRIIKTDFGADTVVDEYHACVVVHVLLPDGGPGDCASSDQLGTHWNAVCSAVDSANAAFAAGLAKAISSSVSDVALPESSFREGAQSVGSFATVPIRFPTLPGTVSANAIGSTTDQMHTGRQPDVPGRHHAYAANVDPADQAVAAPLPAAATPVASSDDPSGDPLLAMAARAGLRRPVPLRILEQCGDRVVIGGPLIRAGSVLRPDGAAATVHAAPHAVGAAVRFMRTLADAVPGVACGATMGDAAAAVLGRGTLRYGVYGVLKHHAADLAEAASAAAGIRAHRLHRDPEHAAPTSVVAVSHGFAAALAGSTAAGADPCISEFLASLAQERYPWALRSLGQYHPFVWSRHGSLPVFGKETSS